MLPREERKRRLRALVEVYAAAGYGFDLEDRIDAGVDGLELAAPELPGAAAEAVVEDVSEALLEVAAGVAQSCEAGQPRPVRLPIAVRGALAGAELIVRAEVLRRRADRVAELLPGFAYLATVPYLEHAEALALAQRAARALGR